MQKHLIKRVGPFLFCWHCGYYYQNRRWQTKLRGPCPRQAPHRMARTRLLRLRAGKHPNTKEVLGDAASTEEEEDEATEEESEARG